MLYKEFFYAVYSYLEKGFNSYNRGLMEVSFRYLCIEYNVIEIAIIQNKLKIKEYMAIESCCKKYF